MGIYNKITEVPVLPFVGLIRVDTVLAHYQISKSQLYQEISEGLFPKQIKIGKNVFWDAKKFREFLKKQGAEVTILLDESR
jgi:predicted DNA-binding transcriptional regulator AlpA